MVTIVIDGKKIKAQEKQTLLEVTRENGIEIPTLCSNDALKPYGACRLCVVEVKAGTMTTIETSCTYPAAEGLEVSTSSPKVIGPKAGSTPAACPLPQCKNCEGACCRIRH
jgi:NADH-quinone oxidoreductase subunit G/NADP-reducing hydrogenase subunit HndD